MLIQDFAAQNGFNPPSIELDGKIHRFDRNGKRNAWYVGFQHHSIKNGSAYQVAVFGDWKTGEQVTYKPDMKLSREDNKALKDALEAAQKQSRVEREIKQKEAKAEAQKIWDQSTQGPINHAYLEKKKIKPHGIRISRDQLIVPMRDLEDTLHGVQRIFPDGSKRFLTGQRTTGLFHAIGEPNDDEIFLCEGFATGASIHEATGKFVVCTFSAHNLVEVAKDFRRHAPSAAITICGDDDRFTAAGNTGREKGEKAAELAQAKLVFPTFPPDSTQGTDFNDLPLEEIRAQLRETNIKSPTEGYVPLGHDESVHFFYSFAGKHVVKAQGFSDVQMFSILPLSHWEEMYPGKKGIRWADAKNDLIRQSIKVGPYDPNRIRGTGVWLDNNRTVINTGDYLVVDNKRIEMTELKSRFIYVKTRNKMPPMARDALTVNECEILVRSCQMPKWKLPKSGPLLAGWIAIARIAGALPIRPHIWITGGAGTGKSTVLDGLIRPALGSPASRLYLQGGSTEAGIRQSVKADSLPILFDEFESNGAGSQERSQNLIDLLRQSWSHTQGYVVKGSAGGFATQYSLAFAALVSSIRVGLNNDADRSRFAVLDLDEHRNDLRHFREFQKMLCDITEDFGERLFARSVMQAKNILINFEAFKSALGGLVSQRFGQQYGMLLAGFYSLVSDSPATPEQALEIAKGIDWDEEMAEAKITDQDECLAHLLTSRVQISMAGETQSMAIGEILKNVTYAKELIHYGIQVEPEYFYVATTNSELSKIYRGTRWAGGWAKILSRLPGANRNVLKRIDGYTVRSTKIPKKSYV